MKDGSDVITGCRDDGKSLIVPFVADKVCLANGPDGSLDLHKDCNADTSPHETSNTWGDFESFNDFTTHSEQLHYESEPLDENIFATTIPDEEGCTDQTDGEAHWDAFNLGNENRQECERIFRLSFPAIPVEDTNEDVNNLETLLTSSNEENLSKLIKTRLWLEYDLSWQSGCEWQSSKGCGDLMMLLKSTAENSSDTGEQTKDALTEQLYINESLPPAGSKNLIQTKLDVAPGSKSGHIFSYQLVLKKSQTDVSLPFLTFSGKKSIFSTNQLRFNF